MRGPAARVWVRVAGHEPSRGRWVHTRRRRRRHRLAGTRPALFTTCRKGTGRSRQAGRGVAGKRLPHPHPRTSSAPPRVRGDPRAWLHDLESLGWTHGRQRRVLSSRARSPGWPPGSRRGEADLSRARRHSPHGDLPGRRQGGLAWAPAFGLAQPRGVPLLSQGPGLDSTFHPGDVVIPRVRRGSRGPEKLKAPPEP